MEDESIQNIKVAVDAVVFGYHPENGLLILLIRRGIEPFKLDWALPGGLVLNHETLEEAIQRELVEETNLKIDYLEQLYSFGNVHRDPRNRVISIAYFALIHPEKLNAGTDAEDAQWFSLKNLPQLAFDHSLIIETAYNRLKAKLTYEPIGFELLDKNFIFSDLEKLYSTVLEKPLDRRNFKKKIMQFGFIEATNEKAEISGAGRPGNLYRFNEQKYFEQKAKGILFEI
ncbi:MAG: NUDIX domain-containing protein [Cytophagales bacterium]